MSTLTIRPVRSRSDLEAFIRVPWRLYAEDPQWVPPLLVELRARLNRAKNPYFLHAQAEYFLAEWDGQAVGRISAQFCELAQLQHGAGTGQFGFFECEPSQETCDALILAAEAWLRQQGARRVLGPFSLSINDEVGLLIEGRCRPPAVFMGHHLPYYNDQLLAAGYEKAMDLYAYHLDLRSPYDPRVQRVVDRASRAQRIQLRPLSSKHFRKELLGLLRLFNEAWVDNWGYVPLTPAEASCLADTLRPLIGNDSVMLTEVDGETAGFMMVLPDLNEWIGDLDGRMLPTNWLRLLWRLKFAKPKLVRVPLLGIQKQHQSTYTGAAIAFSMIDRCRQTWLAKGATHCEMSWILETNEPMRGMIEGLGSQRDKTYRVYAKSLD